MYSQSVNSILSQPALDESESFGEEAQFSGENFSNEQEHFYPYVLNENINDDAVQFEEEDLYKEMPFNNFEEQEQLESFNTEEEDTERNDEGSYEAYSNSSDMQIAEAIEQQVINVNSAPTTVKPCDGRTCWAKEIVNKELGLSLALNNTLDEATKKAINDFQAKNNLPQTQKIDPVTERALLEAGAMQRHNGTALQQTSLNTITTAKTKIEDFTKQAVNTKPQYILDSYRDPRKVYAFVLHHMAFKRKGPATKQYSDPTGYLSTGAHFCIMLDGRIIQLHAMSRMIWHGNCISPRSVAVEFEGNFPNIKGQWWIDRKSAIQNKDIPTQAQYDSGRFLAGYLKLVLGTTHILAHRQSSDSRENDPGPDIWYNVGQWAMDKLGMSDGGPGFKCGTGNPILAEWRNWGNKTTPNKELENYAATEETALENFNNYEEETKSSSTRYSPGLANIYMALTGEKQGQIKGNTIQKGKEGLIAVYAFRHEINSPKDAASGMATGRRMHKPIVITKEVDQASTKLLSALVTNERLKQVVINFWHPGSTTGVAINYYRITLTNALISNISQDRPATPEMNATILERVEMVYGKIEWQYLEGSATTAADDWGRMNELELQEAIDETTSEENERMDEWEEQEVDEINCAAT